MSKVTIAGDVNGSGVFTLAAPNGNTNRTLVLPDEAGTVLTTAGVPSSAMPAGSVLQVVSAQNTGQVSTSSTTYIDTALTATITPISASSKILVLANINMGSSVSNAYALGTVFRGNAASGVNLGDTLRGFGRAGVSAGGSAQNTVGACSLDSPATASALTYTVAFLTSTGAQVAYFNLGNGKSTITLMEIAA